MTEGDTENEVDADDREVNGREHERDVHDREHEREAGTETVADVSHEHPTTGETFDRTGVYGRGKRRPDETSDENAADGGEHTTVHDVTRPRTDDTDDEPPQESTFP
jgi:hypothetical protein